MLDGLKFPKTPAWLPHLFPQCLWNGPRNGNTVYLTFDDGPIPGPTEWVLDRLKEHQQKATFFCVGDNIRKHPKVFERILREGHAVGNHTFHHVNGWKTGNTEYFEEVEACKVQMEKAGARSVLFRPPYGKLTLSQYKTLARDYRICMWDVLTYDFSLPTTPTEVFELARKHTEPGSVLVMHDSLKAFPKIQTALPQLLKHLEAQQWTSPPLTGDLNP